MNHSNYYLVLPHLDKNKVLKICFNIPVKYLFFPRFF
jgi:hypothetical protein